MLKFLTNICGLEIKYVHLLWTNYTKRIRIYFNSQYKCIVVMWI